MALSNINKFSPYSLSGNHGLMMPKLKFRFRVSFTKFGGPSGLASPGGDILELTKQVDTCGRPSVSFAPVVIDTYNSKIYMHGKPEWAELKLVVRDDMGGNVSKVVGQQVQKQFDFLEMSSASSASDYKFNMSIEMLDGGNGAVAPVVLEAWEIYGCFLKDVAYGDLDYKSNDPNTIDMIIRFDNAIQTDAAASAATGVGINVGRANGNMLGA